MPACFIVCNALSISLSYPLAPQSPRSGFPLDPITLNRPLSPIKEHDAVGGCHPPCQAPPQKQGYVELSLHGSWAACATGIVRHRRHPTMLKHAPSCASEWQKRNVIMGRRTLEKGVRSFSIVYFVHEVWKGSCNVNDSIFKSVELT